MNIGGDSVSVYAEAKTEYTRQLTQHLVPSLQIYFLDLFKLAKEKDDQSRRVLWNFQTLLQEIPDWNQDKVLRETEKIQRDTPCDYLEELLTAVFIAHTKVLSAIRISTKQKKLQITVPKMDHFLHRSLRETGRLLWGNAYLYAEQGTAIDQQKNMRQVEVLIQEGILQAIRGLLPVKTILREYLTEDADEEQEEREEEREEEAKPASSDEIPVNESSSGEATVTEPTVTETVTLKVIEKEDKPAEDKPAEDKPKEDKPKEDKPKEDKPAEDKPIEDKPKEAQPQTIVVQTEPSVNFTNLDTVFDSNNEQSNRISLAASEMDEEDEDEKIDILNEPPVPMDDFEDLEQGAIEFEEL
jgi:outer membrane biosynthesis protein TonB